MGHIAAADAAQLRIQLVLHRGHGKHLLATQQAKSEGCAALVGVCHCYRPVLADQRVAQRLGRICQWVVRGYGIDKIDAAQRLAL